MLESEKVTDFNRVWIIATVYLGDDLEEMIHSANNHQLD